MRGQVEKEVKNPIRFSNKEVVGKDSGEWKGRSQVGLGTNDAYGSRDGPGGNEEENTSSRDAGGLQGGSQDAAIKELRCGLGHG